MEPSENNHQNAEEQSKNDTDNKDSGDEKLDEGKTGSRIEESAHEKMEPQKVIRWPTQDLPGYDPKQESNESESTGETQQENTISKEENISKQSDIKEVSETVEKTQKKEDTVEKEVEAPDMENITESEKIGDANETEYDDSDLEKYFESIIGKRPENITEDAHETTQKAGEAVKEVGETEEKRKENEDHEKPEEDKETEEVEKAEENGTKEDMKAEVKKEASEKKKEEVKEETKNDTEEEVKKETEEKVKESAKEDIKQDAKENVKEEVKEEVKEHVKEDVKEDLGEKERSEQDANATVHEINNMKPEKVEEKEEKVNPANESDYTPDKEMPAKNASIEESEPEFDKTSEHIKKINKTEQGVNSTEEVGAFRQYLLKAKSIAFKLIEINVQTFLYASSRVKDQYNLSYPYNVLAVALTTFLLLYFILTLLPGPRGSSVVVQRSP